MSGCGSQGAPSDTSVASSEHRSTEAPAVAEVRLDVGHCWVEPVNFDGQTWGLLWARQFGWGGRTPESWKGQGVMTRLAVDRAVYVDEGGVELTFYSADDPAVAPPSPSYCD